ncbi:hypothetical protein AOL_s00173g156 [Orbilia oligospora ATCC 24927]|uniref:F-box domain-containing protein n=1 Tax=Arthrobotrys oligospora (strain ATCC 24927 / CBS 115.81 / DSM 1491) TaxID=756982 RepID=G1XNY8_ARTOA|nr:hypothetical protein AOL_s00173g156 [Orbilia oligospora ATCC 24927]EGX45055.1 hypothetical protein AOL_s00173g156 [Orbilia oligospora ATCC 24927]
MTTSTPPSPPFLRLPLELQSEIVSYLPFADQLSISLTCSDLSACLTSPQNLKSRYSSCPFDELSFKGLYIYPPDNTVPGVKTHLLLQSFGDLNPLAVHPELFCTVQSGEIREYLYLKGYSYFEKPKSVEGARLEGYTWDEENALTTDFYDSGRFADLDFETIWDPKSEEPEGGKKTRWIMHPHPEKRPGAVLYNGVIDISNSPFLDEPCFLYATCGIGENAKEEELETEFVQVTLLDEPLKNNNSQGETRPQYHENSQIKSVIKATKDLTVRQLLERVVGSLYEGILAVTGPSDEVLNMKVDPLYYDEYGCHWEIGAAALKSSIAELQDMVWVRVCGGEWTEYAILPRGLVEEVKGIYSTEGTENPP